MDYQHRTRKKPTFHNRHSIFSSTQKISLSLLNFLVQVLPRYAVSSFKNGYILFVVQLKNFALSIF